jgi:hypothetical protein
MAVMERWVWFALDPGGRLADGEYNVDDAGLLHNVLRGRGLEPLLVLPSARWQEDLAGGPPGVPPPVRTATEIALLRAEGALELPPMRAEAAERFRVAPRQPVRRRWLRGHRRDEPRPTFAVHARPWSQSLVSVALCTVGGEVLRGTERLFATDDDGLTAAAEWKGQLEFVSEQWLLDGSPLDLHVVSDDALLDESDDPDAHTAARLLDG